MNYGKILLCMTVLVSLAFQACAQSDPLVQLGLNNYTFML